MEWHTSQLKALHWHEKRDSNLDGGEMPTDTGKWNPLIEGLRYLKT
jgi:hypothetical protein